MQQQTVLFSCSCTFIYSTNDIILPITSRKGISCRTTNTDNCNTAVAEWLTLRSVAEAELDRRISA